MGRDCHWWVEGKQRIHTPHVSSDTTPAWHEAYKTVKEKGGKPEISDTCNWSPTPLFFLCFCCFSHRPSPSNFQFQPRKPSTASSSGGTAIDTTAIPENVLEIPNTSHPILQPKAPEIVPQVLPQTALPYNQKPTSSLLNIQPQQFNTLPSQMPSTQTLPSMAETSQSHNPVGICFPKASKIDSHLELSKRSMPKLPLSRFCLIPENDDGTAQHAVSIRDIATFSNMGAANPFISPINAIFRTKCPYVLSSKW